MNKTVVIYESKYGWTRRYAKWIAEELSCPVFEKKDFRPQNFSQYERIIYGGGLYAGSVSGISLITQNWKLIADKQVILFTCGFADPDDPYDISNIRSSLSKVLSGEMMEHICFFHLRGGIDYSRLGIIHKIMMFGFHKMLLKKEAHSLRDEDRQILETYGKYIDFTDRQSIRPLIQHFS